VLTRLVHIRLLNLGRICICIYLDYKERIIQTRSITAMYLRCVDVRLWNDYFPCDLNTPEIELTTIH